MGSMYNSGTDVPLIGLLGGVDALPHGVKVEIHGHLVWRTWEYHLDVTSAIGRVASFRADLNLASSPYNVMDLTSDVDPAVTSVS